MKFLRLNVFDSWAGIGAARLRVVSMGVNVSGPLGAPKEFDRCAEALETSKRPKISATPNDARTVCLPSSGSEIGLPIGSMC